MLPSIPSILPVALLALQGASFVLGGPIQARDNKFRTPTEEEMEKRMARWKHEDKEFVFYIGKLEDPAQDWANERLDIETVTIWDTDEQLANKDLWIDVNAARRLWAAEYARVAHGTAWFYWKDSGKVPKGTQSWYFEIEEPILKRKIADAGDPLEELIQVSDKDTSKIHQILPVDVSDYDGKKCAWHGTAPECETKCPDGTKKITESKYGDDSDAKCAGKGRKVFCCKD